MNKSFELLSSMSPKFKNQQKCLRKGTLLALKKNIRRSSILDKSVRTVNNEDLQIVEISTTASCHSSDNSKINVLNKTPIVISDTDLSDEDSVSSKEIDTNITVEHHTYKCHEQNENAHKRLLSENKLKDIKLWIESVKIGKDVQEKEISDLTTFSEMSTIYGNEISGNFQWQGLGFAVNSTSEESTCKRFDEFFKSNRKECNIKDEMKNLNLSVNGLLIDDSFMDSHGSLKQKFLTDEIKFVNEKIKNEPVRQPDKLFGREHIESSSHCFNKFLINKRKQYDTKPILDKVNQSLNEIIDDSLTSLNDSLKTKLWNNKIKEAKEAIDDLPVKQEEMVSEENVNYTCEVEKPVEDVDDITYDKDVISMLDDLYGNSWRENEQQILPKTEPRKKNPLQIKKTHAQTERKPKPTMLYGNPYLEMQRSQGNLLKSLHKTKIQQNGLCLQRLKHLCDSDSSESGDMRFDTRKKLSFENDDGSSEYLEDNTDTVSKYFIKKSTNFVSPTLDKENSYDYLDLGESLEERVRKKINNIQHRDVEPNSTNKTNSTNKIRPLKEKTDNNKVVSSVKSDSTKKNIGSSKSKTNHQESNTEKKSDEKQKTKTQTRTNSSGGSEDEEWNKRISQLPHKTRFVNGTYSFLASLSANIPILQCDMVARIYRNNFKTNKDDLLKRLFKLYNEDIFENALPVDTLMEWNDRMRGTAGYCYCKKITRRTGAVERSARIVLSTKVVDSPDRLRDTLVHEMCHAATWVVNCVSDGHGPYWKSWAYKAMKTFPELPPIKRCHDYVINTKYTYKCIDCGYSIGRHTKSLDIERKRCGYCYGKFEVLINKISKKGETKSVPATPKKEATGFALFVKENYGVYKTPQRKHGEVMKMLGQKFQDLKVANN